MMNDIKDRIYDISLKAKYATLWEIMKRMEQDNELTEDNKMFLNNCCELIFHIYFKELQNAMRVVYDKYRD